MKTNYSLSGMPDFNPLENKKRDYLLSVIKQEFSLFGFLPLVTSSLEKRSNLFGNYGNEGDKLIFQILKSGDYLSKLDSNLTNINSQDLSAQISDKALRYDLTIPFARFFAQNRSNITLPFRRYEIGSVWRADRPQRGRLREFVQCDADIIGDDSLWLEVDLLILIQTILNKFGLNDISIKINNRKILEGIFFTFKTNRISFLEFCTIIDKIEKIGLDKVSSLLLEKGLSKKTVLKIRDVFVFQGSFEEKKHYVLTNFQHNTTLNTGFNELSFIIDQCYNNSILKNVTFDISLARGLDYYTGSTFEVISNNNKKISLAGGGRYDNLTSKFGVDNITGVGVSLGLDRLYLELDSLNLFPSNIQPFLDVLFINFGIEESVKAQSYISEIRKIGKSVELYPSTVKMSKQMSYANKKGVKYVIMLGEEELKENVLKVKNMQSGAQKSMIFNELLKVLIHNE